MQQEEEQQLFLRLHQVIQPPNLGYHLSPHIPPPPSRPLPYHIMRMVPPPPLPHCVSSPTYCTPKYWSRTGVSPQGVRNWSRGAEMNTPVSADSGQCEDDLSDQMNYIRSDPVSQ